MPVKSCTLKGQTILSLSDLYDQLARQLKFPAHFGRNLDALWDVLAADIEGPFEIVWKQAEDSKKHMGRDYNRIVKLFRELEKERDDFQFKIA